MDYPETFDLEIRVPMKPMQINRVSACPFHHDLTHFNRWRTSEENGYTVVFMIRIRSQPSGNRTETTVIIGNPDDIVRTPFQEIGGGVFNGSFGMSDPYFTFPKLTRDPSAEFPFKISSIAVGINHKRPRCGNKFVCYINLFGQDIETR